MKPVRYVVKSGDSLWSIAEAHYGDPVRWPDLYAYNNRSDIVALTERPIVNPDRMIPGQAIFLPPGHARPTQRRAPAGQAANPLRSVGSAGAPTPGGIAIAPGAGGGPTGQGWRGQAPRGGAVLIADGLARNAAAETLVNDFAHAFHLDGAEVEVRAPAFTATLSLTGSVSLQRTARVPLVSYSSRSAETQARSQSAMLLGQLLSTQTTRLGWDPRSNQATYAAALLDNAGLTYPVARLAQGVTARGESVLKGTVAVPDATGRIANHAYRVRGLAVAVALRPSGSTQAAGQHAGDRASWLWAAAATTSSVLIVGAVLDEDAVTAGSGLADAAATLAATVAGRRGGVALQAFASASPTPVQIGGR